MSETDTEKAEFGCPPPPSLDDLTDDPRFLRRWVSDEDLRVAKDAAAVKAANGLARSGKLPSPRPQRRRKAGRRIGEDALLDGVMQRMGPSPAERSSAERSKAEQSKAT